MIKISTFLGETANGPTVIPLFGPADSTFEKTASPTLLPSVSKYIEGLRPRDNAQYVLVNALGAGEWWGANINADFFSEEALIHAPDDWTGNPLLDRIKAKDWSYGFPTFYQAAPYAHHKNKDASRAFGEIELALWNPHMKRVELVVRVDKDKCERFGGSGIWDKLHAGQFVDVSMGSKVGFDLCSICTDWKLYNDAVATFNPKTQRNPGEAVLLAHKQNPIRGLSITRKDYCSDMLKSMNKIFSDGRKVFVFNPFPRFFDISFVFIGADKTAKVMMKIASEGKAYWFLSSAEAAEKLGYKDETLEKIASSKIAKEKESEITKYILPSQFASKAIPILAQNEKELPSNLLDTMGNLPIAQALSTSAGLGILLRPKEFQRIVLTGMGHSHIADDLDHKEIVFPESQERSPISMGPQFFSPSLARLLFPFLQQRSVLGPFIEQRVLILNTNTPNERKVHSSLSSTLLHKMGSVYNSYRNNMMEMVANTQELIGSVSGVDDSLKKLASTPVEEMFTPLSVAYLNNAFLNELSVEKQAQASGQRAEGNPLKDRVNNQLSFLRRFS